ncbi:hypothetical protein PS2_018346 [Malus domestica]
MILGAKEEVEVTEVDVGVDGDNRKAEVDKEETNIGDGGGLADAAFSRAFSGFAAVRKKEVDKEGLG